MASECKMPPAGDREWLPGGDALGAKPGTKDACWAWAHPPFCVSFFVTCTEAPGTAGARMLPHWRRTGTATAHAAAGVGGVEGCSWGGVGRCGPSFWSGNLVLEGSPVV